MESIVTWFKESIMFVIPGGIYLLSAYFGVCVLFEKFAEFVKYEINEYLNASLKVIIGLVLSYIIGMSIHYASQQFYYMKLKIINKSQNQKDLMKQYIKLKGRKRNYIDKAYGTMVLFRHLAIALFCLYSTFLWWLCKFDKDQYILSSTIIFIILIVILVLALHRLRNAFKEIRDTILKQNNIS